MTRSMPARLRKYIDKSLQPKENDMAIYPRLYIITTVCVGGTFKNFQDLGKIAKEMFLIHDEESLNQYSKEITENDVVTIQQIFKPTKLTRSTLNKFLNGLPSGCVVFTTIHDNYYMDQKWVPTDIALYEPVNTNNKPKLFPYKRVNHIICPSYYIYSYFRKFFYHPSIHVVPHPDKVQLPSLHVPPIEEDGTINIGIITSMQRYKGLEYFSLLFDTAPPHVMFIVYYDYDDACDRSNVLVRGSYHEDDIYEKLIQDRVHGLVFFNKWPESYCYALSKGINSGLPIYYTPIGAVEERLSAYRDSRFHPHDMTDPFSHFPQFLNYIMENQNTNTQNRHNPCDVPMSIPTFYKNLFRINE